MTNRFYKTALIATSLLVSSMTAHAEMAVDCVENIGERVRFVEGGVTYKVPVVANHTGLIANRDLSNSKGVRLENFAAILQQDRANLHKSGVADHDGDFHDQPDTYFTTPERRSQLTSAKYYTDCYMTPEETSALKADIVNGQVLGVIWVVSFQRPTGGFGAYISRID